MMQSNLNSFQNFTFIVTFVVAISNVANAQLAFNFSDSRIDILEKNCSIPIKWLGDSVHSKWEPHVALLLPVKLKNCPKQFYMQFDLGSPVSIFYKNKLEVIQKRYPKKINKIENELTNFSFMIGKTSVLAKKINVERYDFDEASIKWKKKDAVEVIGTIGADLIDEKIFVLDYPNNKLEVYKTMPPKLASRLSLTDFIYSGRSIMLPAKIRGEETMLYFDTGSSMFELLTDKETCLALSIPGSNPRKSKVQSWNKMMIANSLPTNESIAIAGVHIPIRYSTYMEDVSNNQIEHMKKMGIGGMTGNKLFLNYKLVIDTKANRFGLIR